METSKHCPNCKGPQQNFRPADDDEKKYLIDKKELSSADANGYWRCKGNEGKCLWIQPYFNQGNGFTLPKELFG
ncbi:hypothetical protein [Streptomyces sp. VRA16 Mangrove soil]|uniref:hypothetical protein n=1 Tax=Streptomyces sp. VRA16 Mangrove soil TaxID=2817434 RepID=UPI001A9DECE0|nr:hypothetical protein [Streptomyces sp. VRA16 Mangrove soil]MBO1333994.1 hypothetical protein [Streptomyces sp. VRA16 Mangrove soil]